MSTPYLGIHLDAARAWSAVAGSVQEVPTPVRLGLVPPAMLRLHDLGLNDEMEGVDDSPSLRSSGGEWSGARWTMDQLRSRRVTLLDAWRQLGRRSTTDRLQTDHRLAAEAVALVAGGIADRVGFHESGVKAGMAIPNHLDEAAQDALLTALSPLGSTVDRLRLIWRPIASAIAWCQRHGDALLTSETITGRSMGGLLCVHLGIDIEVAGVQLVPVEFRSQRLVVPARDRPAAQDALHATQFGDHLFEDLILAALPRSVAGNKDVMWRLAWTTPWLNSLLGQTDSDSTGLDGRILAQLATGTAVKAKLRDVCEECDFEPPRLAWAAFRNGLSKPPQGWRGAVVTGPFAALPHRKTMLGEYIARELLDGASVPIMLPDPRRSFDPAASGGALFAARAEAGWPTYLDTLPKLELLVVRKGEPEWLDVLRDPKSTTEAPQYVDGNQEWVRSPDLEGVTIPVNERTPRFDLLLEGHPTARRTIAVLPVAPKKEQPVVLNIRMRPASGFARIRVLPANTDLSFSRPVLLSFHSMTDTGKTRKEVLSEVPRGWPAVQPRQSSPDAWDQVVALARLPLSTPEHLSRLRKALVRKDNDHSPGATAVSSDGDPPAFRRDGAKILAELVDRVALLLPQPSCMADAEAVLGYTSVDHPSVRKLIERRIAGGVLSHESLILIGNCARDPVTIAKAMAKMQRELVRGEAVLWRLVAIGQVCMYREAALERAESAVCIEIVKQIDGWIAERYQEAMQCWERRRKPMALAFVFREACRSMLFLLRRRRYAPDFLPKDGELAMSLKDTLQKCANAAAAGEVNFLNGMVKQEETLMQISKYIDWQGSGVVNFGEDG